MSEPYLLLDASALVELLIDGEHRADADRLLDRIGRDPDLILVTAAHALTETTNALRRLVRHDILTATAGSRAIGWLHRLDLVLDATGPRLNRIWELRNQMTAYDAAYAAAADALALPVISTDQRLLRACAATRIPALHLRDLP